MNSQSKFLTLPPELREHAVVEMQPADLLSLSQTCKELRQFTSSKRIWVTALRSMCRKYGLFEPSFPDESMELVDIQRAALGPALWHRRITELTDQPGANDDTETSGLQPRTRMTIKFESEDVPDLEDLLSFFCQIHLVPGGRWLFGLAFACIVLMDLGLVGGPAELKGFTHSDVLDEDNGWRFERMFEPVQYRAASDDLNKEKCKDTLRFAALVIDPNHLFWLHVYEVGPLPDDPSIRLLAKTKVYGLQNLSIFGDMLFLKFEKTLVVWDYIRCLSASWTAEISGIVKFAKIRDWVIGTTTTGVCGWRIPTLEDMGKDDILGDPGAPNSSTPHFQIELDEDALPEVYSEQGFALSTWWQAHHHHEIERGGCTSRACLEVSIVYHVLGTSSGWDLESLEEMDLWRYDLGLHIPDNHDPSDPVDITEFVQCNIWFAACTFPEMIGLNHHGEVDFPRIPHHSLYDDSGVEYALFMMTHRRTAQLLYSPLSLGKAKAKKEGRGVDDVGDDSVTKWDIIDIEHEEGHPVKSATLCPWSGRMAYICDDELHEGDDPYPIHVLDFFGEGGK
ncbi:hypothetical protein EST38_g4322 [Candolleomyces aberdarensis]|uniref:F-box domain-containing protein n=1 Tax=Candolleomyces aberdarensis TaxID=2316362 RepID=A0A4Q2DQ29_9AGAR|nr:hypothetical protein EST38_g4322 [Candolleomyces aberdarensis]